MSMEKLLYGVVVMLPVLTAVECVINLRHMDTVFLPKSYNPDPVYEYGSGAAIASPINPDTAYAYIVGNQVIQIVDILKPGDMKLIDYEQITESGSFTDAEICNNWLAVSFDSIQNPIDGKVFLYKTNPRGTNPVLELRKIITVGYLPEAVLWTRDCRRLIVAVEGEVTWVDVPENIVDPEGEIVIYDFSSTPEDTPTITRIDFTKFNAREEEYIAKGIRRVYRGEGMAQPNTFSQDLEPEFMAFNDDQTVLYITLQEANAIAVVDLITMDVSEIYPLGEVDWSKAKLDPSNKDNMVNIKSWPIFGARQSDAVAQVTLDGISYLVTANEGDDKEYDGWSEEQRGRKFIENGQIASSVDASLQRDLADDSKLGRLKFSTVDGKNSENKYERFVAYGGRGFSVFRASDMKLMWDSGSELEEALNRYYPDFFNANTNEDETPSETKDTRSDDKGPEPETVAIGQINGKTVVLVGLERPGAVAVYTMEKKDGEISMTFQSILGPGSTSNTWGKMWEAGMVRDLDIEDIRFVPIQEGDNTIQASMLVVCGAQTGTFSIYEVTDFDMEPEPTTTTRSPNIEIPSGATGVRGLTLSILISTVLIIGLGLL